MADFYSDFELLVDESCEASLEHCEALLSVPQLASLLTGQPLNVQSRVLRRFLLSAVAHAIAKATETEQAMIKGAAAYIGLDPRQGRPREPRWDQTAYLVNRSPRTVRDRPWRERFIKTLVVVVFDFLDDPEALAQFIKANQSARQKTTGMLSGPLSPALESSGGVIQYEKAIFYIGSGGALLISKHQLELISPMDGFEYLRVMNDPQPSWHLEGGSPAPDAFVHTHGVEIAYGRSIAKVPPSKYSIVGFRFRPMKKGESLSIVWEVYSYQGEVNARDTGWLDNVSFEYSSPVQWLEITFCAPSAWNGNDVEFRVNRSTEYMSTVIENFAIPFEIQGDQKEARYRFNNLTPGLEYIANWRPLPEILWTDAKDRVNFNHYPGSWVATHRNLGSPPAR